VSPRLSHIGRLLRDFIRERRAVAVVEFAIVMPMMVMLTLGTFEATRAVRAKMKADFAAQTFADLIAAQSSVDATALTNYCNGAQMVMVPYTTTSLKAAIASVTNGVVDWTDTTCGSATAISNPTSIATSLSGGGGNSVIIVQTTYAYTSPLSYLMPASITLKQTAFARPRNVTTVQKN
jgi:Flp pilus assembly protein TadG